MTRGVETAVFTVPARHNPRLQALVERIDADEELRQLWHCANINAVDRLGLNDHGEVHIRIVANAALRLLRLLRESGYPAGLVSHHRFPWEDAEVAVVVAAALHDLGIAVHYDNHAEHSLPFARLKAKELLAGLYPLREQTILIAEILHAIVAHHGQVRCLTLEAGILKLADALDMTAGRIRPAALNGGLVVASDSIVEQVLIKRGEDKPVRLELRLNRASGLPQIEELLQQKLQHSPLFGLVEVMAHLERDNLPLREIA